jgi:hypothetical protein
MHKTGPDGGMTGHSTAANQSSSRPAKPLRGGKHDNFGSFCLLYGLHGSQGVRMFGSEGLGSYAEDLL